MRKLLKNEIGITLISLVVTIIVLLILAGITIATITGENGILNKAKLAVEKNQEAEEDENNKLSSYEDEIDKYSSISRKTGENSNKTDLWTKWLDLAGVDYSKYEASQILNNEAIMKQVMESETAVDYMIQSKTFLFPSIIKSDVAVSQLVKSSYALDKCMNDDEMYSMIVEHCDEIAITVPTMTSNTEPEGEVFATEPYPGCPAYLAFDNNSSTDYAYVGTGSCYIGYKFVKPVNVYKFELVQRLNPNNGTEGLRDATVYYSDDGNTWTKASDKITLTTNFTQLQKYYIKPQGKHQYWKIETSAGYGINGGLTHLQFYGI